MDYNISMIENAYFTGYYDGMQAAYKYLSGKYTTSEDDQREQIKAAEERNYLAYQKEEGSGGIDEAYFKAYAVGFLSEINRPLT